MVGVCETASISIDAMRVARVGRMCLKATSTTSFARANGWGRLRARSLCPSAQGKKYFHPIDNIRG